MKAVLRPDRRADAEDVEFMVFGHKVVDTIVSQVLGEDYEGATGTRVLAADGDLPAMKGMAVPIPIHYIRHTRHRKLGDGLRQ